MKISLIFAATVLALTACTSVPPAQVADSSGAKLDEMLAKPFASKEVAADMKAAPAIMAGPLVNMSFTGEAKTLLKQVAAARDLSFQVRGPQPHLPLFVLVDVKGVSLEEFLQDVGSQMGQRADVVLTSKSIEVHYRAN